MPAPLILTGPPGCGKSYWIQAYAKEHQKQLFVCACRKDRTLREGRQKLHILARRTESAVLWLEGADDLTPEAQAFLRRILETHAKEVQFVLECRDAGKLQEPIRSRCILQRLFSPSWETLETYARTTWPFLDEKEQEGRLKEIHAFLSPEEYSYRRIQQCVVWIRDMPEEWQRIQRHRQEEREEAERKKESKGGEGGEGGKNVLSWIRSGYHPEKLIVPMLYDDTLWNEYGRCVEVGGSRWAFLAYALEHRARRPMKQEEP